MIVKFLKQTKVNGIAYFEGDTLSVSSSISKNLIDNGDAKEYVEPKPKKKKSKSEEE